MTNPLLEKLKQATEHASTAGRYEAVLQRKLAELDELYGEDEVTWMVQALALPHWFDYPLMERLFPDLLKIDLDMDFIGQPHDYAGDVFALPFVSQLAQAAGDEGARQYVIDDPYRKILRQRWLAEDEREELVAWSGKLRDHFSFEAQKPERFDRPLLLREALFHQFITNEAAARSRFRNYFEEAAANYQIGVCQQLVGLAEEQEPFLQAPTSRAWLHYYRGRLGLLQGYWPRAEEAFKDTLAQPHIRANLRGRAWAGLGDVRRAAGEWSEAMQAYERSLREWHASQTADDIEALVVQLAEAEETMKLDPADLIEVARVLSRMANLSERMGRPRTTISDALQDLTAGKQLMGAAQNRSEDDKSGVAGAAGRLWRSSKARSEADREQHTRRKQYFLSGFVRQRLQNLASMLYATASTLTGSWPEGSLEETDMLLANDLALDIRFGQARVGLDQKEAERSLSLTRPTSARPDLSAPELFAVEASNLAPHDQAELSLAQGDWYLADQKLKESAEKYEAAIRLVSNSWDRPLLARAHHKLGRAQLLEVSQAQAEREFSSTEENGAEEESLAADDRTKWTRATANLKSGRAIFAALRNPREEQVVQETIREVLDLDATPGEVKDELASDMADWPAHYFAYPSSADVVNKAARIWWPVVGISMVVITLISFTLLRVLASWLLGQVDLAYVVDIWWVNVFLFLYCGLIGLTITDMSDMFRAGLARQVGARLKWDQIWGSQPDFIMVDDERYMQVDGKGAIRAFDWANITKVRSGHSDRWIIADSSLTATGRPGGRTILYSTDEAGKEVTLRFDASLNSYMALDALVKERVPETTIIDHKEFSGTFRGMTMLLFLTIVLVTVCGCPITFILTSDNNDWWMVVLKVLAGAFAVIYGLTLGVGAVVQLRDAIRMRGFLYGRNLPPEPEPDPEMYLSGRQAAYDERGAI